MTWKPSPELQAAIAASRACHEAYLELNMSNARSAADRYSSAVLKARALAAESWTLDAHAQEMFRREALGRS